MGKYFKYAIGEILLVVIGILIALQINNWNEQRKIKKQELKLLEQLYTDLESNKSELIDVQNRLNYNKDAMDSLLVKLKQNRNNLMIPINVAFTQRKVYFNATSSGYNMLQNGMASIITNDSILKNTLDLYENNFKNILAHQNEMHHKIENIQNNFTNKLFRQSSRMTNVKLNDLDLVATDLFEPIDFEALSKNDEYIINLLQLKKIIEMRMAFTKKTKTNIEQLLSQLKEILK